MSENKSTIPFVLVFLLGIVVGIGIYTAIKFWYCTPSQSLSTSQATANQARLQVLAQKDKGYEFIAVEPIRDLDVKDFLFTPDGTRKFFLSDKLYIYDRQSPSIISRPLPQQSSQDQLSSQAVKYLGQIDTFAWDPSGTETTPVLWLAGSNGLMKWQFSLDTSPTDTASTESSTESSTATDNQITSEIYTEGFTDRSRITSLLATADRVYATDSGTGSVRVYDSLTGRVVLTLVPPEGRFEVPGPHMSIAKGLDGLIWVSDPGRSRMVPFRSTGECEPSLIWGSNGNDLHQFSGCNPSFFVIDSNGRFITAEKHNPRVKVYSPAGDFLTAVCDPTDLNASETTIPQVEALPDGTIAVLLTDSRNVVYFKPQTAEKQERKP